MKKKSFELGPHKIAVKYQKRVVNPDTREEVLGMFDALSNFLYVSTEYKGHSVNESVAHHTYHHELAHAILILMNRWDLNNDETFVDMLGMFLAQYDKTKK